MIVREITITKKNQINRFEVDRVSLDFKRADGGEGLGESEGRMVDEVLEDTDELSCDGECLELKVVDSLD